MLVKGMNKHQYFCSSAQSKFISHPDNSPTQGLPVGGHLSSPGFTISWQRGGNKVVKAYLILENLSPEVTRFTSTPVPVAALFAPPPRPVLTVDPVSCVATGAAQ